LYVLAIAVLGEDLLIHLGDMEFLGTTTRIATHTFRKRAANAFLGCIVAVLSAANWVHLEVCSMRHSLDDFIDVVQKLVDGQIGLHHVADVAAGNTIIDAIWAITINAI
jgi:hypothetical protein